MTITSPSADDLRRMMTDQLTAAGALRSEHWIDAFAGVPRHVFVPEFTVRAQGRIHRYGQEDPTWLAAAYRDTSLLTQFDATGVATSSSTRPSPMATMLEALDVVHGNHVLEIGVGTGYNAALLAHRLGGDHEADRRDGMAGCAEHAPYDRLPATCGVGRIPDAWREQVRPGGVIVANVGYGSACLMVDSLGECRPPRRRPVRPVDRQGRVTPPLAR
ncbi:methyltransferase domain-containing protein [Streptomyces corynorhini]|uniref:Protein-L-isoaspartate O-methyltransferase n=1 Tax=Streptomyces corynorhini TaxID=2282652 RepID=A0A370B8J0_9ACTN|nr:hypothetical protein [Streptomyces corynorhini]RDG36982.1 hypothetical protein DVH02_17050 [Streptomyces corynorhini]